MTAQHSAGAQIVAESRRSVDRPDDGLRLMHQAFFDQFAVVAMLVAAVARAAAANAQTCRRGRSCQPEAPFLERHAQREEQRRAERMAHDALHAKKRQLQAQKSHANRLPSIYRKTSNSGRTSELLLEEPARGKASQPELDIDELDALPSGSL